MEFHRELSQMCIVLYKASIGKIRAYTEHFEIIIVLKLNWASSQITERFTPQQVIEGWD